MNKRERTHTHRRTHKAADRAEHKRLQLKTHVYTHTHTSPMVKRDCSRCHTCTHPHANTDTHRHLHILSTALAPNHTRSHPPIASAYSRTNTPDHALGPVAIPAHAHAHVRTHPLRQADSKLTIYSHLSQYVLTSGLIPGTS